MVLQFDLLKTIFGKMGVKGFYLMPLYSLWSGELHIYEIFYISGFISLAYIIQI